MSKYIIGLKISALFFTILFYSNDLSANERSKKLDVYLKELAESASIPGISFGLIEKGSQPVIVTVGVSNTQKKTPVSEDTIFQAASLSKPVFAYIVLSLVKKGEFSLDKPLFEVLDYPRVTNKEWGKLITARHVLSHQTGFPNWSRGNLEFNFKPGSDFGYSGEGYVYLQKVVEKISGLTLQALAQREVFKPLGMGDSYFTWDKKAQLKLSQGHDRAGNQIPRGIPEANAAASLNTTPSDYLKFIRAWFDVNRLTADVRQEAFKSSVRHSKGEPETEMGWGLGWGVYDSNRSKLIWHWGDNGIFRAFVAIQPATESAFVYFTNSENGLAIGKQITEKIFPGNQGIFNWLNYGQADSPLWQTERKGYELESKGQFVEAAKLFHKVLKTFPDNQRLKSKIKWLEPLITPPKSELELDAGLLNKLSGQYGERRLFVEDGKLTYQREMEKPIH